MQQEEAYKIIEDHYREHHQNLFNQFGEDAVQDVYTNLLSYYHVLENIKSLDNYVFQSLNKKIPFLKEKEKIQKEGWELDWYRSDNTPPELGEILDWMESLEPEDRFVAYMTFTLGYTEKEVRWLGKNYGFTNLTPNRFKKKLKRLREEAYEARTKV